MLRVDSNKPYKLVYSLCKHAFLGYLIEPHVVQLNLDGNFSLTHQRLFSTTAREFDTLLDAVDYRLITLLEEIEQSQVIKKWYKKSIQPLTFFSTIFNEKLYEQVRPKIEKKLSEALQLLKDKELYLMSKEGWPAQRRLHLATEPTAVLFHFRKNKTETRYFPTLKYQGMRIEFMFKNAQIICNQPAWLFLDDVLYYFKEDIEGKKLQPFLNKRFIAIPASTESTYFERFVAPLIEKYNVYAEGFEIRTQKLKGESILKVLYTEDGSSQLQLSFRYGNYIFPAGKDKQVEVRMEKQGDDYIFYRLKRSLVWEKNKLDELLTMGLKTDDPFLFNLEVQHSLTETEGASLDAIDWLNEHHEALLEKGFTLEQPDGEKRFFFGSSKIDLEIKEDNDWFDIHAIVHFGPYQIPFIELKNHILNKIKEFRLPSGEFAVIPERWFSQFNNLLNFAEGVKNLKLKRHHISLIRELQNGEGASIRIDRKLQRLADFEEITDVPIPLSFYGTLRPYQKAGYNWFHFLRQYHLGGCLADDMGLGKTVQTLALLQKIKEENQLLDIQHTSLIVMPTSLIYNWQNEAAKFAPQLKIGIHMGSMRHKNSQYIANYDVVLTTYGILRVDADLLKGYYFDYIILDESQNIKNATSKAFRAARTLRSKHKLVLSGTPVENSINDLWTQMSFVNPGLLGNQAFFQTNFVTPIEKKKDEERAQRLQSLIKPFVLRRTKEMVATELPPKTEHLFYCKMSDDQGEYYEKIKSEYRNEFLQSLENGTFNQSKVQFLQGLTKLRQIANHPEMIDQSYAGDSGKFENVIHTLENVLSRGHRALIFSQFVKQLDIYRRHFDAENRPYVYLDGTTKNRAGVVQKFQNRTDIQLFLISIKAGGVGLNLTAADYVFILDPWWNPAVEQQAIDRTHRIGQTNNVFIYKFITKDTVEEKILALQKRKRLVAESLITTEESFTKSLSAQDIQDILN
jgi:SNF2 family DNA or RNA helicase